MYPCLYFVPFLRQLSLTNPFKDKTVPPKIKIAHLTITMPLEAVCHPRLITKYVLHICKIWRLALAIPDTWLESQNWQVSVNIDGSAWRAASLCQWTIMLYRDRVGWWAESVHTSWVWSTGDGCQMTVDTIWPHPPSPSVVNNTCLMHSVMGIRVVAKLQSSEFGTKFQRDVPLFLEYIN